MIENIHRLPARYDKLKWAVEAGITIVVDPGSDTDVGMFYCPYIPLMVSTANGSVQPYKPQIGFKTRYDRATSVLGEKLRNLVSGLSHGRIP